MGWFTQAKAFFKEIRSVDTQSGFVEKEDLEYVSSVSEARLLDKPEGASFLIVLSLLAVGGFLVWSLVMEVDEVAKAQGKVIPSQQVQVIQNLEGGIVKEVRVVEGQAVKKGDVLLVIDDVYAKSDVQDNVNAYNTLLARLVALNAHIAGKRVLDFPEELRTHIEIMSRARERFNAEGEAYLAKIKGIEFEMDQRKKELDNAISDARSKKENYEIMKQQYAMNRPLLKSGAISKVELLKIEQQLNEARARYETAKNTIPKAEAALNEAMQKRESYIRETKVTYEKERNDVKAKLNTMQSKGVSLKAKLSHSIVKSPVVGTIKKIYINTIGGVVRPGMDIMEIVPTDNELLIEVKIKPKDIGFIEKGQQAKVKITAFDFSTYGGLKGTVEFISADTITDKKGNSFYLARIRTKKNYIVDKKGKKHIIIPGMKTEADIILDKKSILAYILKPMLK